MVLLEISVSGGWCWVSLLLDANKGVSTLDGEKGLKYLMHSRCRRLYSEFAIVDSEGS